MTHSAPTVLYLTRFYLPTAAAAGIRADRFVNALLERGLRVIVATVGDQTELIETAYGLIICRVTDTGQIPDRLLLANITDWPRLTPLPGPDPDPICSKAIYRAGQGLIYRYNPQLIFATGLPFGLAAVGCRLAQTFKLPLVLELRDAWCTGMPWPYPSSGQKHRAKIWERICLEHAEKIITETQTQKNILDRAYPPSIAQKTVTIRHSYDPAISPQTNDHLESQLTFPNRPDRKFTIAYTGQLRGLDLVDQPWPKQLLRRTNHLLRKVFRGATFCENLRLDWMSPHYLMKALAQIAGENPNWRDKIELIFVGQKLPRIDRWARRLNLADQVRQLGPQPPKKAQNIVQQADLLILNLYGIKNLDYHWCVPGKTYTYLGSGKPILALLPPGEARDLVTRAGVGFVVPPDDIAAIEQQLTELIRQHYQGGIKINPDWNFIRQFALPVQQKQFAYLIISVINGPQKKDQEPVLIECAV